MGPPVPSWVAVLSLSRVGGCVVVGGWGWGEVAGHSSSPRSYPCCPPPPRSKRADAVDRRDNLAAFMYEQLFCYVLSKINSAIALAALADNAGVSRPAEGTVVREGGSTHGCGAGPWWPPPPLPLPLRTYARCR